MVKSLLSAIFVMQNPAKGSRNKHLKDVHKIESVPKDPVETNNTHDPLEI